MVRGLDQAVLIESDMEILLTVLIEFVQNHPAHQSTGTAIWALSKWSDDRLFVFFLEQLRIQFKARRSWPASQADYGLMRLGARVEYDFAVGERLHDGNEGYWKAVEKFLKRHSDDRF